VVARQLQHSEESPSLRGPRSFGRNDDGTVNPAEARILRELWPRITRHDDSVYRWVQTLNERGVKTSRGNVWTSPGLSTLLRNPRLAGYRRTTAGELEPVEGLEPIVSLDEHLEMCAVLERRAGETKPRGTDSKARTYLLSGGIVKCGRCGKNLHAKKSDLGTRGYACLKNSPHHGCGRVRIAAQPLEEAVAVEVLGRLASDRNLQRLQAAVERSEITGRAIAASISEVIDEQRALGKMYHRKEIGKTAFAAADAEYQQQLRTLRAELKRVESASGLPKLDGPEALTQWWEHGSTVQERHDLVAALVDEIRILPSKRVGFRSYDPDRVEIVWRTA
jgi:hypothetical protein